MLNRAVYLPSNKKAQFVTVIENGKINLYRETEIGYTDIATTGPYGTQASHTAPVPVYKYYMAKGTDTVAVLYQSDFFPFKSKKGRKDLAEMLADNKRVYDKFINDDKFSFEQIKDIIHLYNTGKTLYENDYIINHKNDTIFCEIEPITLNTAARYRVNLKDRFTKIDTSIVEYYLAKDSSSYLLKTLPKEKRAKFVKCLVKGRISLYAYSENPAEDSEASLYVSKGPGELVQIKHAYSHPGKSEKEAFINLISDNSNINEEIKNLSFDFSSILNYVKMYDNKHLSDNQPTK